jgi:major histocompatibility complex class I
MGQTLRSTQREQAGEREEKKTHLKKVLFKPGVVAHAFNPSTREAEAGGFLSSRPSWSTK